MFLLLNLKFMKKKKNKNKKKQTKQKYLKCYNKVHGYKAV